MLYHFQFHLDNIKKRDVCVSIVKLSIDDVCDGCWTGTRSYEIGILPESLEPAPVTIATCPSKLNALGGADEVMVDILVSLKVIGMFDLFLTGVVCICVQVGG